jgi:cell division protein FtsN
MCNYHNRQQGGTVIGIVIGLVVGLGIALAVAMSITKTPMPFMNKVVKQEKLEPTAGQAADPNKPLYGNKAAAKEAARALAKPAEPDPIEAVIKAAEARPAVIEVAAVDRSKQAGFKTADVKLTDAKKAPEAAEDKFNYYLQAGAFRDNVDAENTRAKLALLGVEARVTERQSENGLLYRVRVGPFGETEAMNRVRGKLSDNGVDAAIVRIAKQN